MRRAVLIAASLLVIAAPAGLLVLMRARPESRGTASPEPTAAPATPPIRAAAPERARAVASRPSSAPAEAAASFEDGARLVRNAVQAGRWTQADAASLEVVLSSVTPEQQTELLHALVPAINRGQIKLTYRGAIF